MKWHVAPYQVLRLQCYKVFNDKADWFTLLAVQRAVIDGRNQFLVSFSLYIFWKLWKILPHGWFLWHGIKLHYTVLSIVWIIDKYWPINEKHQKFQGIASYLRFYRLQLASWTATLYLKSKWWKNLQSKFLWAFGHKAAMISD